MHNPVGVKVSERNTDDASLEERVEMRRQEVLRALKMKWLDDRDRVSG